MKPTRIVNLSFDIPAKVKGSMMVNDLTRKDLVTELIKNDGIELSYQFTITNDRRVEGHQEIVYPVKTTMVFASTKSLRELNEILSKYNKKLYYVITEVVEPVDDYLARMVAEYELQRNFNEELQAIKEELNIE